MTFRIQGQEFQLLQHRNYVSVRTTIPKEALDDGKLLLPRIRGGGFSAGDHITVQVMSQTYEELLHEAEFVVTAVRSTPRVIDDGETLRTKTATAVEVARLGDWWDSPLAPKSSEPRVRWNVAKRQHEVIQGNEVVFASENKDEARAVARGEQAA